MDKFQHNNKILNRPILGIILNGKGLKEFPLSLETRQTYPLFPIVVLEVSLKVIRQVKDINGIKVRRKEGKLFLFIPDIILYIKEPGDSIRKFLQLIKHSSKCNDIKWI